MSKRTNRITELRHGNPEEGTEISAKRRDTRITPSERSAISTAKKHINRGPSFPDLILVGNIALMKAVD
jgi:DNA-directed RNA polymerase sigma subunit (sigma70/sigma32)